MKYSVTCKSEGRAALDFYSKESKGNQPFSAIIVDLTIPAGMGEKNWQRRSEKQIQ
jgi:hypothetical protein